MTAQLDTLPKAVWDRKYKTTDYNTTKKRKISEAKIYYVSRATAEKVVHKLNEKGVFVESIQRHLEKASLKRVTGLKSLAGISGVYVSEEREGRVAHNLLPYNQEFQKHWGNQPIYGNVLIVLGQKAYNSLPSGVATTDVDAIVIQKSGSKKRQRGVGFLFRPFLIELGYDYLAPVLDSAVHFRDIEVSLEVAIEVETNSTEVAGVLSAKVESVIGAVLMNLRSNTPAFWSASH